MFIKFRKFHRLFVDDFFFINAAVLLIVGTVTVSLILPYNQTEVNVRAGIEAPPPNLTHILDLDAKLQDASSFILNTSIFAVKFSFLFFFRLLLQRTGKLQVWWWFVFIITIPCAVICMCTGFMVCPAFGARILGEKSHVDFLCYVINSLLYQIAVCVSDTALKRQITVLYTVVVLDILTDLFCKRITEPLLPSTP